MYLLNFLVPLPSQAPGVFGVLARTLSFVHTCIYYVESHAKCKQVLNNSVILMPILALHSFLHLLISAQYVPLISMIFPMFHRK